MPSLRLTDLKNLYLAHPTHARRMVREFELSFEKRFGTRLHNPFYDGTERDDIASIDRGEKTEFDKSLPPKRIVEGDLSSIDKQQGLLGVITDDPSVGTFMEIFYNSHVLQRPSFLVILADVYFYHPWLIYHSNKRFHSFIDFENWWNDKLREESALSQVEVHINGRVQ